MNSKLGKLEKLQCVLIFCMTTLALVSMFFNIELYPFAPFTMYSYRHQLKGRQELEVYCLSDDEMKTPLTDQMLSPLDEARLKTSLEADLYRNDKEKLISHKLHMIASALKEKEIKCPKVIMEYKRYNGLQDYLDKKGEVIFESEGIQ